MKLHNSLKQRNNVDHLDLSIMVDSSSFSGILSLTDDDVKQALLTLDVHDHNADNVNVQGNYANIPGTPTDLESSIASMDSVISSLTVGSTNWISNGDAEHDTAGWDLYSDDNFSGMRVIPLDGTGGSPSKVLWSRSTVDPLEGNASFLLSKLAGDALGEGVSYDFTPPKTIISRLNLISFDYKIESGVYNNNDIRVFIYNPTNNIVTLPLCNLGLGPLGGRFVGFFNGYLNSTDYRLIFHVSSPTVEAFSIKIDKIRVFSDTGLARKFAGMFRYTASSVDVGNSDGGAYCPTTRKIYMANGSSLQVINPFDLSNITSISLGSGTSKHAVAYCPSSDRIYVSCSGSDTVRVVNQYTETVDYIITTSDRPESVLYCPTNDRIYVFCDRKISVVDPCSSPPSLVTTISHSGLYTWAAEYCPTNNRIYMGFRGYMSPSGAIYVINPEINAVIATIGSASGWDFFGFAYNPTDDRLYMVRYQGITGYGYFYALNPANNSYGTVTGSYQWLGYTLEGGFFYHPFYNKLYCIEYDTHVLNPIDRSVERYTGGGYEGFDAGFVPEAGNIWSVYNGVVRFFRYM